MKQVDIRPLEKLAKLTLSQEERMETENDLGYIIKMADELFEIDTTNVPNTYSVSFVDNVYREDNVEEYEEKLYDDSIKVPGIME